MEKKRTKEEFAKTVKGKTYPKEKKESGRPCKRIFSRNDGALLGSTNPFQEPKHSTRAKGWDSAERGFASCIRRPPGRAHSCFKENSALDT